MPNIYTAEKIANFFNCSFNYLFGVDSYLDKENFKMVDIKQFYPRYKDLLDENKVSHYYLFKHIGLNNSSFLKWKNGSIPKMESLIKIAKYFNVSIDYLIGRSDTK